MATILVNPKVDFDKTAQTQKRYQRLAPIYDAMQVFSEKRVLTWRQKLWSQVHESRVLEVGVGTGKNIPFYPENVHITAIDLVPAMVERARRKAVGLGKAVDLRQGDIQDSGFPSASFDAAVATCVFCSVPDPVLGLKELKRVVKPGGRIYFLEHMRSPNPKIGRIMDLINPVVARMMGANINRETVENIKRAGLMIEKVEDLAYGGIFKLIVARTQ